MEKKHTIRLLRLPREIWGTLAPYLRVIREAEVPRRRAVALNMAAGLLEGSALLALIPIINHLTLSDATPRTRILARLGLDFLSNSQQVAIGLVAFVILGLAFALMTFYAQSALAQVEFGVLTYTLKKTSAAMFNASWPAFLGFKAGEIHKSMLIEGHHIGLGSRQVLMAISQLGVVMIFLFLCTAISPYMTLATLLFAAFGTLIYLWLGLTVQKRASQLVAVEAALADLMAEIFDSFKFFRLAGAQKTVASSFAGRADDYHQFNVAVQRGEFVVRLFAETGVVFFLAAFLLLGIFVFDVAPGAFLIFLAIFYRLIPRILNINSLIVGAQVQLKRLICWQERLARAAGEAEETSRSHAQKPGFSRALQVRGLTLTLPGRDRPILNNVSFELNRKQFLAVVGPSGSGKTTLIDCVAGLFPQVAENVLIDDTPLRQLDTSAWQRRLGIVQQRNPVFYGSIAANIAWGEERIQMERVRECARLAKAHEFIEILPAKFETVIGRGGTVLSLGQEQRLAIARALYRQPDLLILDEATSALDASSEEYVLASIEELRKVCAILMVSHQLRAVRKADLILVLDHGSVVALGRWDELMAQPGSLFQRLAGAQGL